jgi:DNA polymerase
MSNGNQNREAAALLQWYAESGVDEALDPTPVDRFALARQLAAARPDTGPPERIAARSGAAPPRAQPPRAPVPQQVRPDLRATGEQAVRDAKTIAEQANSLDELAAALAEFNGCGLKETAKNLCFYDGDPAARLMFIGEAPGRDEDLQGKPFVGRAGQLLNKMIQAIGLEREEVHITNIVFWRPPGNRNPTPVEAAVCRPFTDRQLALVKPQVIVFLGGAAAKAMLDTTDGIMRLRGKWRSFEAPHGRIDALATLHPAYLLRNPAQKRLAWRDFLEIRKRLDETG